MSEKEQAESSDKAEKPNVQLKSDEELEKQVKELLPEIEKSVDVEDVKKEFFSTDNIIELLSDEIDPVRQQFAFDLLLEGRF